ncbi:Uncharacterised protein [Vibrio cholerae]|nr:Uncharacterised protein [Vibrio cholerae]
MVAGILTGFAIRALFAGNGYLRFLSRHHRDCHHSCTHYGQLISTGSRGRFNRRQQFYLGGSPVSG